MCSGSVWFSDLSRRRTFFQQLGWGKWESSFWRDTFFFVCHLKRRSADQKGQHSPRICVHMNNLSLSLKWMWCFFSFSQIQLHPWSNLQQDLSWMQYFIQCAPARWPKAGVKIRMTFFLRSFCRPEHTLGVGSTVRVGRGEGVNFKKNTEHAPARGTE